MAIVAGTVLSPTDRLAWAQCQLSKIVPPDGAEDDYFGIACALSTDVAIVGAIGHDSAALDAGAAYIIRREGAEWGLESKLVAPHARVADGFGHSVAIFGHVALVGALYADSDGKKDAGAAYVFVFDGTRWNLEATLHAGDGEAFDKFGTAVATHGKWAIVGARGDDDAGKNAGAAYVFKQEGRRWIQEAKLIAGDLSPDDVFGASVAFNGDFAVVGATQHLKNDPGAAYIFRLKGGEWIEEAKLVASDRSETLGNSVAVDGDWLVVGDPGNIGTGSGSGAAYVYHRDGGNWSQVAKLLPNTGGGGGFGQSVSISGDYILVGDNSDSRRGGSTYLFNRIGDDWVFVRTLLAGDPEADDHFGYSAGISGGYALVGAWRDDDKGDESGSAYTFWSTAGPDCNGNQTADVCDIASGRSLDENGNMIPDECEGHVIHASSGELNVPIPDNSPEGVADALIVSNCGEVQDVDVGLFVEHPWSGDLIVHLEHDGASIRLWDRQCGSVDDLDAFFNDEGRPYFCHAPSTVHFQPLESLSAFDGLDTAGPWTLKIADANRRKAGTLVRWSLSITTTGGSCCTASLLGSVPEDGSIDAREEHEFGKPDILTGTQSVTMTFDDTEGVVAECFTIGETGVRRPPHVQGLKQLGDNRIRLDLGRPITAGEWTTITYHHTDDPWMIDIGFLPGDVNQSRVSTGGDISDLIDCLNQQVSCEPYQTDMNRSGVPNGNDITRLIDILTSSPQDPTPWLNQQLPPRP